jgi:hypothetical protein
MAFSWFSPYLGGGSVGNLTPALPPLHLRAGWGWGVAGWVLPFFPSLLTCGQGWEPGDSPYTWQALPILCPTLNVPRNLSSLTLVLTHTHSQTVGSFWGEGPLPPPHSSFLFPVFTSYRPLTFPMTVALNKLLNHSTKSILAIFPVWWGRGIIPDMPTYNK